MAKLWILVAFLAACPVFAQTSYEHFRYHPYAEYRYYHPHPYTDPNFDYTKYYPYRYHWSAHRWYAPYNKPPPEEIYIYHEHHHYNEQPQQNTDINGQ